jgi:hypothetical protein
MCWKYISTRDCSGWSRYCYFEEYAIPECEALLKLVWLASNQWANESILLLFQQSVSSR